MKARSHTSNALWAVSRAKPAAENPQKLVVTVASNVTPERRRQRLEIAPLPQPRAVRTERPRSYNQKTATSCHRFQGSADAAPVPDRASPVR